MAYLSTLKAAQSLEDLAHLLRFTPSGLSYILYILPDEQKYQTFSIPKRGGGDRTIHAPKGGLKLLQRRLSDVLQTCLSEIEATAGRADRAVHGFKRGRSIVTNARRHRHRRYVFNVDLEDFFPSINFGRIRGYFIKNRDFQLHPRVATVLAQIACRGDSLPQGSPCSPVISNLITQILDIRLIQLARRAGVTYSRYADDLTFSTNKHSFPAAIGVPINNKNPNEWAPSDQLRSTIQRAGFKVHPAKTHLMYRASRQEVTGLVVNERINVRQSYRREVRAMAHSLIRTGEFRMPKETSAEEVIPAMTRAGNSRELHGRLGFIDTLDRAAGVRSDSASERVYRDFLMYTIFYAATRPVILCEGETDNIYLTHAIRSLAADFPTLATQNGQKVELNVRLYKYPRSSTARVLGLNDGGAPLLATFIGEYKQRIGHFAAPGLQKPVIVLYDNDDGAKPIHGAIKSVTKKSVDVHAPYTHIHKNLYAVPVQLAARSQTAIEDCFDEATRSVVLGGKIFAIKDFDPDKHYGKKIFAKEVVRPHAAKINFSGFRTILENLAAVIAKHQALMTPD